MPRLRCVSPDLDDAPPSTGEVPEDGPGGLLADLERRQDEVLAQLDALGAQVEAVLAELGIRVDVDVDIAAEV